LKQSPQADESHGENFPASKSLGGRIRCSDNSDVAFPSQRFDFPFHRQQTDERSAETSNFIEKNRSLRQPPGKVKPIADYLIKGSALMTETFDDFVRHRNDFRLGKDWIRRCAKRHEQPALVVFARSGSPTIKIQ